MHVDLLNCPTDELVKSLLFFHFSISINLLLTKIQSYKGKSISIIYITFKQENRALELIESQFIIIYTKIENAFDEEATIDLSTQNTYIHLKGRRAFKLLHEFCDVFTENEPIYKILPLSKSESFQTMQKLNKYIKLFILKEEENININKILSDLNMEKINIYLTIVERV